MGESLSDDIYTSTYETNKAKSNIRAALDPLQDCRGRRAKEQNFLNNGEFDPGSGCTLAIGLTHASRGVTCWKLASDDDDRRMGA